MTQIIKKQKAEAELILLCALLLPIGEAASRETPIISGFPMAGNISIR